MSTLTPEQVVLGSAAEYGIVWDVHCGKCIVPQEVLGSHPFSEESRHWTFDYGEGCVGRAYSNQETLVIEDDHTGDSMFMRKSLAKSCGINTIAFVPQADGSVLEVGFERKLDELPKSWWMKNILESYANSSNEENDIYRMRTPSPGFWIDSEMAPSSLKALAQVAVGIHRSLALLQPSSPNGWRTQVPDMLGDSSSAGSSARGTKEDTSKPELSDDDSSSDIDWEDMPKPLLQLSLLDYIPEPPRPVKREPESPQSPTSKSQGKKNRIPMINVPQYDAYEPSYLKFVQSICSLGSVGHPYSCGGACKYMKTQKGCKVGVDCDRCHLCEWTRRGEREMAKIRSTYSVGSVGHPHFCSGPCKYHTRKECRAGRDCDRCHLCTWTRSAERKLIRRRQQFQEETFGKPHACGEYCQYKDKEKDGSVCGHCHLSF